VFITAALACGALLLFSYRDQNIKSKTISDLSDFNELLTTSSTKWSVKPAEFNTICFTGNYVFALAQANSFLLPHDVESIKVFDAASGLADVFNGSTHTSIVLFSRTEARILQLDRKTGFSLTNVGCANVGTAEIQVRSTKQITELELLQASIGR
jgi:hypothetical protein